ncbi:hypothetical protein SDC9_192126 [bioreactor metagenome]|uniref:Uncharacterized protein n=1 Tax=bioreactor metagenome TaxID=1076179 RepID=A0A645HZT6_9ZZZZ
MAALVLRDLAGCLFKDAVRELDDDGVHHIRRVADLRIAAVAAHHRLIAALGQLEEQGVVAGDVVLPVKYSFCEFDDPAAAGEKFRQFCAAGQTRLDTRQQLLKTQEGQHGDRLRHRGAVHLRKHLFAFEREALG